MKKVSFIIGLIMVFGLLLTFQNVVAAETKDKAAAEVKVKKTGEKAAEVKDKTAAPAPAKVVYHGNKKSNVFHAPGCKDYDCKNCTEKFASKEDAVKAGYKPDKACVK